MILETEAEVAKMEGYLHDEEIHNYIKYYGTDQCFSTAGPRGPSSYRKKDLPGRGLTKVENHRNRRKMKD
jgi:hypothetical protein